MSSFQCAEAELCAMTENSKELVSLLMLLESILDGIPLTILGTAVYNRDLPFGFAQRRDGRDQHKLDGRVVATRPAHRLHKQLSLAPYTGLLEVQMSKKCTPLWREDIKSTRTRFGLFAV